MARLKNEITNSLPSPINCNVKNSKRKRRKENKNCYISSRF